MALAPEVLIRGLAFVRYLYTLGLRQSAQPGPAGASALLVFHDAVEMLLVLGLQHHDRYRVGKNYMFHEYWTELEQAGVHVTLRGAMETMNRARIGLKHHTIPPDRSVIEAARVHVRDFLTENTVTIFGQNFDEIELSSLVTCSSRAQEHLKRAEHQIAAVEYDDALGEITYAFHRLLQDHEAQSRSMRRGLRLDPLRLPPSLQGSDLALLAGISSPKTDLQQLASATSPAIDELQAAVRVLGLGLDFSRWTRFLELAPRVIEFSGDQLTRSEWHGETPPTPDQCRFCYDFVIDSALRIQETQAEATPP